MPAEVRLFAALRAAAGAEMVVIASDTVADLIAELASRFGEPMATRLQVAVVMVDGTSVPRDDTTPRLQTAQEIVLLPPFAGG